MARLILEAFSSPSWMEPYKCGHPPSVWTFLNAEDPGQVRSVVGMAKKRGGAEFGAKVAGTLLSSRQGRDCICELTGQVPTTCRFCLGLGSS